jgi:hypothetical protein
MVVNGLHITCLPLTMVCTGTLYSKAFSNIHHYVGQPAWAVAPGQTTGTKYLATNEIPAWTSFAGRMATHFASTHAYQGTTIIAIIYVQHLTLYFQMCMFTK